MSIKLVFTGGGSGGHTMPALAMIKTTTNYLRNKNMPFEIVYIGSKDGIEKDIIQKENVKYIPISTGKLRRYFSFKNFLDIFNIFLGIIQSFFIIKKIKPSLVFSTGGFVSVPPVIGAFLNKVPVIIHEQTIEVGLANKFASFFATKIALTFKESIKYFDENKCILTGLPLRDGLFNSNRENAFLKFGLDRNKPVLYFTGGGLGCHKLNMAALEIIDKLLERFNVIYQTGKLKNDYERFTKLKTLLDNEKKRRFVIFDFLTEELADVYAITDLAIARSGAGTVNEFAVFKIPAIFIPLAIATKDEQKKNAMTLVNFGCAEIIDENSLTGELLYEKINEIIFTDKISKMKENFKNVYFKRGNEALLILFEEILNV